VVSRCYSVAASIFSTTPTNIFDNVVELIKNGLAPSDLADIASAYPTRYNSETNVNLAALDETIYPKKSSSDAPHSLTEAQLREVFIFREQLHF
jgi:hypothetical protein